MLRHMLLVVWVLALTSCALLTGNADYRYTSVDPATGREVTVRINSGRDVPEGGELEIAPDGTLKVKTGALNGNDATSSALAGIVAALLPRVLPVAPAAPAPAAEQPQE